MISEFIIAVKSNSSKVDKNDNYSNSLCTNTNTSIITRTTGTAAINGDGSIDDNGG